MFWFVQTVENVITVDIYISQSEKASSKCLTIIFLLLKIFMVLVNYFQNYFRFIEKISMVIFTENINIQIILLIGLLSAIQIWI